MTNNAFNSDPAETWLATACFVVIVVVVVVLRVDHLPDSLCSYKWLKNWKWIRSNLNGMVDSQSVLRF